MKHWHNPATFLLKPLTAHFGDAALFLQDGHHGVAANEQDDFGVKQADLFKEVGGVEGNFFRQRVSVLRRAATDDVGNVDIFLRVEVDGA